MSSIPAMEMSYIPGFIMLAIFLAMMLLMYLRRISALIALPVMALLYALVGIPQYSELFRTLRELLGASGFALLIASKVVFVAWLVIAIMLAVRGRLRASWAVYSLLGLWVVLLLLNYKAVSIIVSGRKMALLLGYWRVHEIVDKVIHDGALKLYKAYTVAMFGGMLAILVKEKGIAETFIKYAAELAGDNPRLVAFIMLGVSFVLFTTLGGLGAIIMVGTIILPIMMTLGISPLVAAGIFLVGMSAGGSFNPGNWVLYEASLRVDRGDIQFFALVMIVLYFATGVVFILLCTKRRLLFDGGTPEALPTPRKRVSLLSLFTPVVPIILVFRMGNFVRLFDYIKGEEGLVYQVAELFGRFASFWDTYIGAWEFIPAFLAGIVFCLVTTWEKDNIKIMTKAAIEGAESVMPAVLLMFGIGMLLAAVQHPDVSAYLNPIITKVTPGNALLYIVLFGIGAPLALYRGPLNIWGLGLGIAAIILGTGKLSGALIMAAFMAVGAMQGVCDPTNTHNVWIAAYINEDVINITKKLVPFIWVLAVFGLVVASFIFGKGFTG